MTIVYIVRNDRRLLHSEYHDLYNDFYPHISNIKKYNKELHNSICGRVLAVCILSKLLNMKYSDIKVCTDKYGKPYINSRKICFNISHSDEWIGCAFSKKEVGIDIEDFNYIDPNWFNCLLKKYLNKQEIKMCESKDYLKMIRNSTCLWTLKEAYIKAVGEGFHIPMHSLEIFYSDAWKIKRKKSVVPYRLLSMQLYNNSLFSVCTMDEIVMVKELKDINALLSLAKRRGRNY